MNQKRTELCLGIIDPYNTINVNLFFGLETAIEKSISAIFVHIKREKQFCGYKLRIRNKEIENRKKQHTKNLIKKGI